MSNALEAYREQIAEVKSLSLLHREIHNFRSNRSGASRGRRADDLQVLHKSAVVLLTACWEAYVENIIREAMARIAKNLADPSLLHMELRLAMTKASSADLRVNSKHELYPWFFAGDGWRSLLLDFVHLKLEQLNTPDSGTVRSAFRDLLGIPDITQSWGRQRMSASQAVDALDEYLKHRHSVAHGILATQPQFSKAYIDGYTNFLEKTVIKTDSRVDQRISELQL